MAKSNPPKLSKLKLALIILGTIAATLFFTLLVVLAAMDKYYIPILSPLARFLAIIFGPLVPLIFPAHVGLFLRVLQHPGGSAWPKKNLWVFVTALWVFQHFQRVYRDLTSLYLGRETGTGGGAGGCKGMGGFLAGMRFCGWECKGVWVELGLTLVVLVCQSRGWDWDGGLGRKWVEEVVKLGMKQEDDRNVERMEDGIFDEKEGLVVEEFGGDMEKQALLVEVDEEKVQEKI